MTLSFIILYVSDITIKMVLCQEEMVFALCISSTGNVYQEHFGQEDFIDFIALYNPHCNSLNLKKLCHETGPEYITVNKTNCRH